MSLNYNIIVIYTNEDARWKGKQAYAAIIEYVRSTKTAARCLVMRGVAGCYENGELASSKIEVLSINMPLKIEIIVPSNEIERILPGIEEIVTDGIIAVEVINIRSNKTQQFSKSL